MNLSSIGSSLVIWSDWFGVTHWYNWFYGVFGDLRSISGYTESLGESNRFQRLLKQSSTISTSAEGPNIFVFVFSNYTDIIYAGQEQFSQGCTDISTSQTVTYFAWETWNKEYDVCRILIIGFPLLSRIGDLSLKTGCGYLQSVLYRIDFSPLKTCRPFDLQYWYVPISSGQETVIPFSRKRSEISFSSSSRHDLSATNLD